MPQQVAALALCPFCVWRARCSGDTVLEVATFLRALVITHMGTLHAEVSNPPVIVERLGDEVAP